MFLALCGGAENPSLNAAVVRQTPAPRPVFRQRARIALGSIGGRRDRAQPRRP
jgi:hypothetical protein